MSHVGHGSAAVAVAAAGAVVLLPVAMLVVGWRVGVWLLNRSGRQKTAGLAPLAMPDVAGLWQQLKALRAQAMTPDAALGRLRQANPEVDMQRSPVLQAKLREMIHRIFQLYVNFWYGPLSLGDAHLEPIVEALLWTVVDRLQERLQALDLHSLLLHDLVLLVKEHLNAARSAETTFPSHPCMTSPEAETEYLRQASACLLRLLLPERERSALLPATLLQEVLAGNVLKFCRDFCTDPDFANQQIIWHLSSLQEGRAQRKAQYAYAANYAAFVRLISECNDVGELQDIRYHIIAEILQAKQVRELQQLLKAGNADKAILRLVADTTKAAHLKSRNLSRYLNQCNYAKSLCEKRIALLGGPSYATLGMEDDDTGARDVSTHHADLASSTNSTLAGNNGSGHPGSLASTTTAGSTASPASGTVNLEAVAEDGLLLGYFLQYLSSRRMAPHMKCWLAAQDVRTCIKELHYAPAHVIVSSAAVFHHVSPDLRDLQLPGHLIAELQPFLVQLNSTDTPEALLEVGPGFVPRPLGLLSPRTGLVHPNLDVSGQCLGETEVIGAFLRVQRVLSSTLQQQYRSFALSEHYRNYVHHTGQVTDREGPRSPRKLRSEAPSSSASRRRRLRLSSITTDADSEGTGPCSQSGSLSGEPPGNGGAGGDDDASINQLLVELRQRMSDLAGEIKLAQMEGRSSERLERQAANLSQQCTFVEHHMESVANYWTAVGTWQVEVQSIVCDKGKASQGQSLLAEIAVHRSSDAADGAQRDGWVIYRTLEDFKRLHLALKDVSRHLPKAWKPRLRPGDGDKGAWPELRGSLQHLVDAIMSDVVLQESQALYTFLRRGSQMAWRGPTESHGYSEDPFSAAFYDGPTGMEAGPTDAEAPVGGEETEVPLAGSEEDLEDALDSVARPIYALLQDVFRLQGLFQWLRRTMVSFARITFGSTLNRLLKELVDWCFYEPQLEFYLDNFLQNVLVDTPPPPPPTPAQREQHRAEAQALLLASIPEVLTSLVGRANCHRGVLAVFEALQCQHMNKHLFYTLLELLLTRLFPELPSRALQDALVHVPLPESEKAQHARNTPAPVAPDAATTASSDWPLPFA